MDKSSEAKQELVHAMQDNAWQRLSPIALLYFSVSIVRGLFSNIIYLIPAFAFAYSSVRDHPVITIAAILALLGALLVGAFCSFQVYRFRLSENHLEIRSGIIKKTHVNLPFARIQNVRLEQPLYYRLTGFACLELDTAGSAKQEAKLVALPLALAEQLKQQILGQVTHSDVGKAPVTEAQYGHTTHTTTAPDEHMLNQRSLTDLVIHGLTSNRIWLFLGGLAPFYNTITEEISDTVGSLGIDLKEWFNLGSHSVWQVSLYALSLTLLILLIMVSFSVLGSIISFYGFTLSKVENRYIRRSGLLTKHEVSMPLSRLQLVIQKQDWLDVLLGRMNLNLEQSHAQGKNSEPSGANNKIIIPSITSEQSKALTDDMFPDNQLFSINFLPISHFYLVRYIGYLLLPLLCLTQSFAFYQQNANLSAVLLLLFILASGLVYMRWRRWGVAYDEKYIYVRRGVLGLDYYCFPAFKVQQSQFKQSLMMKKRQLASAKFVLACGSITLPMLPESMAYEVINGCLHQVGSTERSWM
ncbi:MAG: putative membrane protein [Paraglaciecola sp.]|jgi:putative membrane protein